MGDEAATHQRAPVHSGRIVLHVRIPKEAGMVLASHMTETGIWEGIGMLDGGIGSGRENVAGGSCSCQNLAFLVDISSSMPAASNRNLV
jgi:hypothetical protein